MGYLWISPCTHLISTHDAYTRALGWTRLWWIRDSLSPPLSTVYPTCILTGIVNVPPRLMEEADLATWTTWPITIRGQLPHRWPSCCHYQHSCCGVWSAIWEFETAPSAAGRGAGHIDHCHWAFPLHRYWVGKVLHWMLSGPPSGCTDT